MVYALGDCQESYWLFKGILNWFTCWLLFCITCHPPFTGPLHFYLDLGGEMASSSPESLLGVDLRLQSFTVGNELVVGPSLDNTSLAVPQQLPGKCQKRERPELERNSGLLPREPLNIYGILGPGFMPIAELFFWSIFKYISLCPSISRAWGMLVFGLGGWHQERLNRRLHS